ncbi:MAG TPA: hypothetical protein VGM07_17400 [Stellaceae bacterium]|jgi:hypothetical protein
MIDKKSERVLAERGGDAAVAEFIRTRGITRCPTACVLPTQASVAAGDRALLEEYAAAREQRRRVRASRQHAFFPFSSPLP